MNQILKKTIISGLEPGKLDGGVGSLNPLDTSQPPIQNSGWGKQWRVAPWRLLHCLLDSLESSTPPYLPGTVDENIIVTIKMRNNFCYPLIMVIFPILR